MHDEREALPRPRRGVLEHLQVAVGIAEGGERPAADDLLDVDRLAFLVVDEVDARQLDQHRLAVTQLELLLARGPDYLVRWYAIGPCGEGAHELHAAA